MSWRITGQILDPATGETVNGVITALLDRTPARTSTGGVIERKASSIPVVEGDIIDTPLNSVPGAVWTFVMPLGQRSVRMVDPGDGASIDIGGDLPVGTPVPESEAVLLRREWGSLREQTIDAVDTITSSVDAATQAAGTIADVVALKPKINQSITDAASAKQASSQAVTLAQNANAGTDQGVAGLLQQEGSQTAALVTLRQRQPINVGNYGTSRASVDAAIADAEKRGKGTVVYFPAGTYDFGGGLSLSGKSVQIRGDGAHDKGGTTFKSSAQSGPVLDFTGWSAPSNFLGRTDHGGFSIVGDGVADPSKNNAGLRVKAMSSALIHDIVIRGTGGPCLDLADGSGNSAYLHDWERITMYTPVGAAANDVPYFRAVECNGNRFRGFGFRSTTSSGDVGASGAVVITGGSTYIDHDNFLDAWWFEYLHVPNGGTLINLTGVNNVISNPQFFDVSKETGATGTSYVRFNTPSATTMGHGGNCFEGVVPGNTGTANSPDMGIDMRQSYNSVRGVKGYKGKNVTLAPGVDYCYVALEGSNGGADLPAVVDNSGGTRNIWRDGYLGIEHGLGWDRDSFGNGPRFATTANSSVGYVWLGKNGVGHSASGVNSYLWQDEMYIRPIGSNPVKVFLGPTAAAPSIRQGAGSPNGAVAAAVGSLYVQTDGGAGSTLWVKESGTGNTGWAAK